MFLTLLFILTVSTAQQHQRDDYEKRESAILALKTCLTVQQSNNVVVAVAKATCRTEAGTDTGLGAKLQLWKSNYDAEKKQAIVDDWYRNAPHIKNEIELLFPVSIDSASASEIAEVIGATGSTEEIAADVKQYQRHAGAESWATVVKTCKAAAAAVDKDACVTSDAKIVELCTKTANSFKCCGNGNSVASTCGKTDALRVVQQAADEQLSNGARDCSQITDTTPEAVQVCVELAAEAFTATTGEVLDEVALREKLSKGAKDAAGEAVKACLGNVDATLAASAATVARKDCRGGEAAKRAMADALGKNVLDVTATDAAKYARDGAKYAGQEKMKVFAGTIDEKLAAAKTEMAAAVGKRSDCMTWTKECMTDVDAKKAITAGAQDCMVEAVVACTADTETGAVCSHTSPSVKDAVLECTGLSAMTDEKLGSMQAKAKAGKIVGAYQAAAESCTGDVACVQNATFAACASAKGSACGEVEVVLGRNRGAAKEMAETMTACMSTSDTSCATAQIAAYESATGQIFTSEGAAKLQKDGAKGEIADLMSACFATKVGAAEQRKCSDPAELPEIKEAFAAALGQSAAEITNTEYKAALVEGAKAEVGLAIGACLDSIVTTGSARTSAVKACHTAVIDEVRIALGKPLSTDMSDKQVQHFLQKSAKDLEKDKFEACFETAAGADSHAMTLAQNNCRGKGAGGAATRTAFKDSYGKANWTDERAEKEMRDNALEVVADDFVNCMDTRAPRRGGTNATGSTMKTAFATCQTTAKRRHAALTGELVVPWQAQKDCVRAVKRKVAETVEACQESSGQESCGDPAKNPDLLFRLQLMTGKIEMTKTEARALVQKSANSAAGDFMKTCIEQVDGTFATCLLDGKKTMGLATGEVVDNKAFVGGLREAAEEEVTDAVIACVASGQTRGSSECKKAKVDAFKATGLGDGKTEKQIKRMVEESLKKGTQKSIVETIIACLDLAADEIAAKTACHTNEIRDAKIAKAEAEGKQVVDIEDADVAKDLEKGKEQDTSSAMEACTEKAVDSIATRACVAAVERHVATTEGMDFADLTREEKNVVKGRMNRAGANSFAKKMNACMEAAELEGDIASAKNACRDGAQGILTSGTGKIGTDIREGDVEIVQEDATVRAFAETNIAIAKAVMDGETYTDNEKQKAVEKAVNQIKATVGALEKSRMAALKKTAGARALGDKAVACVRVTTSDAEAFAACSDANLMEEKQLASGTAAIITDIVEKGRAKREAVQELLKYGLKSDGEDGSGRIVDMTVEATKVATLLKRQAKMWNDKKQAVAEYICDKMKAATGTKAEKRTKMKLELKRISVAKDGSGRRLDDITDEELDAALDMGAKEILDIIDDCDTVDRATCRTEVEVTLQTALGCQVKAVQAKKNQIAKLIAAQKGADIQAADDAKTAEEKVTAPVKTEEEIQALMKTKFESVGGVPGTFDAYKAEIKKVKDAYLLNTDYVIKKKQSIDIVVAYAGACVDASDTTIQMTLEVAESEMDIEKIGTPTLDTNDNKCKEIYRAKRKTGHAADTGDEWSVIAETYTAVTATGRRLNGRPLTTMEVSAAQTTEAFSQEQPSETTTVTPIIHSTEESAGSPSTTTATPPSYRNTTLSDGELLLDGELSEGQHDKLGMVTALIAVSLVSLLY